MSKVFGVGTMSKISCGALVVLTILLGSLTYFFSAYVIGAVYFGGAFLILIGSFFFRLRTLSSGSEPSRDKVLIKALEIGIQERHGILVVLFMKATKSLLDLINWPVGLATGVFLSIRSKRPLALSQIMMGQIAVPPWLGNSGFTMAALFLLYPLIEGQPFKSIALCFVAATYLNLIRRTTFSSAKDDVLSRPGNPKISFAIILFYNLAASVLTVQMINLWLDGEQTSFSYAIFELFTLGYVRTVAENHGLTFQSLAGDLSLLSNVLALSYREFLLSALNALIYLAFLKTAFEIFKLRREPRHFAVVGFGDYVLGRFDSARKNLDEASSIPQTHGMQLAIALIQGRSNDMERLGRRYCANCALEYCPEEGLMAAISSNDFQFADQDTLLSYLGASLDQFDDIRLFALLLHGGYFTSPPNEEHFHELNNLSDGVTSDLLDVLDAADYLEVRSVREYLSGLEITRTLDLSLVLHLSFGTLLHPDPLFNNFLQDLFGDEMAGKAQTFRGDVLTSDEVIKKVADELDKFINRDWGEPKVWEALLLMPILLRGKLTLELISALELKELSAVPQLEVALEVVRERIDKTETMKGMMGVLRNVQERESRAVIRHIVQQIEAENAEQASISDHTQELDHSAHEPLR